MDMLSKFKYLLLALLGFSLTVTPAFAAAPAATKSNEVKTRAEVQTSAEVQVRACQEKQQVIRTRMENLLRLSSTMTDVFDSIQSRVDEYYQVNVVKYGGSAASYEELVREMKQQRSEVETALQAAGLESNKFSCDNDNPKGSLVNFRKDMQAVKTALKDYRTSVKNFIVAVKAASKNIPTPEPAGEKEE
jgi:hypothetical protein